MEAGAVRCGAVRCGAVPLQHVSGPAMCPYVVVAGVVGLAA